MTTGFQRSAASSAAPSASHVNFSAGWNSLRASGSGIGSGSVAAIPVAGSCPRSPMSWPGALQRHTGVARQALHRPQQPVLLRSRSHSRGGAWAAPCMHSLAGPKPAIRPAAALQGAAAAAAAPSPTSLPSSPPFVPGLQRCHTVAAVAPRPRAVSSAASAGPAAVGSDAAAGGALEYESRGSESGSDGAGSMDSVDGSAVSSGSSSPRRGDVMLTTRDEDTIASIVTGMSHGSVAIIRLSGTDAVAIASKVFRPGGRFRFGWQPETHRVYYGTAVDGDERLLDEVLLLVMLSPRSYTAEDVVELHCHGGGVCASRVLRAVIEAGARPAKPGEFTLRAFLNGRLDLAQAEAVSELVSARTAAAADSALAGLQGGVGAAVSELRARCLDVLAELEARLDFDEDLPPIDVPELKRKIERIQAGIESALRTARAGSLLRSGLQVAIVGRPNVGKSSLLNAWTNSDRAIVTEIAGTTRDVLEATLSVGGVPMTLLDTAGIRHSDDVVEKIGVERSQAAAAAADIVVMVVDGAVGWTDADSDIYRALWGDGPGSASCKVKGLSLLVANKDDLRGSAGAQNGAGGSVASTSGGDGGGVAISKGADDPPLPLPLLARETFAAVVRTSASERRGLETLDAALLRLAGAPQLASGGVSWSVNERQAEALVRSHEALMRLADSVSGALPLDFWTIDLRAALLALGEVSGDEVVEEVLDTVFSRFCIGK
ncbi:hypothetical protein PLESTB_000713000 [Pleodorina starrii]|uniref:TrmE-type G domain-containing protein n=1 Tax=Pleodorina starrii TaxID=330485 RepID=A0A9W6BAH1_9CHLO|nr:hypothetical protein PLESTM_000780400 [Pleodorina starrii]GLC48082.1 hypothetical protein PLESTB_000057100 [Pleodorina starrii]GLC53146.1 hypothetical protein PLESTB_000713000 [Pleodorina starrii]GLC68084.1 hypothetical protein PLESTF_000644300 [Pleodorina starrii]